MYYGCKGGYACTKALKSIPLSLYRLRGCINTYVVRCDQYLRNPASKVEFRGLKLRNRG
jgi:hypothetical protein